MSICSKRKRMFTSGCFWTVRFYLACIPLVVLINLSGCASTPWAGGKITDEKRAPIVINAGLCDYQVFQRNENNQATIDCHGSCAAEGVLQARILKESKPVKGLDWRQVGHLRGNAWSAKIDGIPVGGLFQVEICIKGPSGQILASTVVDNILVGDLWVLAGQSNMQGYGDMINVEIPSPFVHSYGMNEKWSVAEEPLHWLNESPDPVHHPNKSPEAIEKARQAPRPKALPKGASLGLPFAKELYARTKIPIGLVPCAHGGTSMAQWDPAKKDLGGNSLYGSMIRRFHAVGGRAKGLLWYQGESDANPKAVDIYRPKFIEFIEAVRRDSGDPQLPFYFVQISRYTQPKCPPNDWMKVREDERIIGLEVPGVAVVSAIDLQLDDPIHIGTNGHKRLGRRLAKVADHELFGNNTITTGPKLKSVTVEGNKHIGWAVRVTFDQVNGRLKPEHHIAGFSLYHPDGKPGPEFFDTIIDPEMPNCVLCKLHNNDPPPFGMNLYYGYGLNPYCNLVDEQDMAMLCFGPWPIPEKE